MTSSTDTEAVTEADPDEAVTEAEVVEPDAAPDAPEAGTAVELSTPRGSLTLRPNQSAMDPEQKAALLAIGIDLNNDPGVVPHLRAFVHMCQIRELDPWAREAYLIGRGEGNKRKYTMQTGIDGYRKLAADTGRFVRVVDRLWTGKDDDDRSYYRDDRGVMRRVWYDQWPESRGWPGAAKVIIEHWNEDRTEIIQTEAVADWGMYAPMVPVFEWGERRGQKVFLKNPDGSQKMDLNDMWSKGAPHMLAKCAEALAIRMAFPRRTSGIYTHEEMHRLDQEERNRASIEQARSRQNAFASATAPKAVDPTSEPIPVGDVAPGVIADVQTRSTAPSDATAAPEATEAPEGPQAAAEPSGDVQAGWLRDELAFQAETLGHSVTAIAARQVKALRKNVEDFTLTELLGLVAELRPAVATRLAESGADDDAATYRALPQRPVDVHALFGEEPETEAASGADPDAPHSYDEDGGMCRVCGLGENVGPH